MASSTILLFVVAMIVAATTTATEAQTPPSCASKLIPCAEYLNSTTPPRACCDPLKEALRTELPCLCAIFNDKQVLSGLGVDVSQAINLPKHCGVDSVVNACQAEVPTPHSSASLPPPATAGGKDDNGVGKMAWTGVSSLILLGTSLMLW